MPKTKISEYSTTNTDNSDIESINIAEGCAPSGINNAIRELMVHLKEFQTGSSGDPLTVAGAFVASGGTTANTMSVTGILTASGGTVLSGTNTMSGAAVISGNINSSGTTNTFSGGNVLSGTNTLSGTTIISGNATISGTTNTISGSAIISGNINSSGSNTFSGAQIISGNINSSGTNTFSGSQIISGSINSSGSTNTFSGNTIFSVNSSSDAVRITQTGAGNALVVEDSANPDATPFVVANNGNVIVGSTLSYSGPSGTGNIQSAGLVSYAGRYIADDTNPSIFEFQKYRSTGTQIVNDGDALGRIQFSGYDGASAIRGAQIFAAVDGTPGTNDMPGRLVFSTTADGASSPTERMRIDSKGNVGIGAAATAGFTIDITKAQTGATTAYTVSARINPDSTVTSAGYGFSTFSINGVGASTPNIYHFSASQGTYSGTAPTNQYGFVAQSALTGATNNYGFFSNIASGTGRWNFYANGTADNYFGGPTTISVSSSSDALRITQTGAGNALVVEDETNPDSTPFVVDASGNVIVGTTTPSTTSYSVYVESTSGVLTSAGSNTAATSPTIGTSRRRTGLASVVSGDSLGKFSGFGWDATSFVEAARIESAVDGTPGTNDMPGRLMFSTTADGASSPTERMRIDSAGNVGIGTTSITGYNLRVRKNSTGATTTYGIAVDPAIQTDVSGAYYGYLSGPSTAASSNLASIRHFEALQGTLGASTTITNQYGFLAGSTLTGATNNYGFYSNIASGSGRWNFYANGTAENYLGGNLKIGGTAARATTAGTNHLSIFNGTAPAGTLANGVTFYSDAGEAKVMDAAGNATLLSPHDPVTNEWIYYSVHTPTGKKLRIDMEKMMRFLNDHFDLDFVHEE